MKCDICSTNQDLLTNEDKTELRSDWAGVDFYSAICRDCFNKEKGNN